MEQAGMQRLTETDVNDWLDAHGMHEAAREPGVYALRLRQPSDDLLECQATWADAFDADAPGLFCDRLAGAKRLVYVGYAGASIYERVCAHCNGEQSASIMQAWPPVGVVGVWPGDGEEGEFNRAQELADDETCVWWNGEWR